MSDPLGQEIARQAALLKAAKEKYSGSVVRHASLENDGLIRLYTEKEWVLYDPVEEKEIARGPQVKPWSPAEDAEYDD